MVLTGLEILEQIKKGNIVIDPFDPDQINPNSYNLKLHNKLKTYNLAKIPSMVGGDVFGETCLDMKEENQTTEITIPEEGMVLQPNILYLGRTVEFTKTVGFVPQIEGRSSVARLGIDIHKTAGWGDDGFANFWTLEIVVTHPVRIYPFVKFCQIIYMKTFGDASMKYQGKYQDTREIDTSKLYEEFGGRNA